jgi:predicted AlkP superfamily phosphohydrolase/phosphomutase
MIRVKLLRGMLRKSVALLPLLLVACWIGRGGSGRVLLVGIDGATLRVARPLMAEGRLPNLERIGRLGVFGPLRSHFPLSSPRIWTSIATGKLPEQHGILGIARPRQGSSGQRLYLSLDRKVHALWNIASDAGLTVGVVNWWNTYPLEKIRGVMVSDHVLPGEISGRSTITGALSPKGGSVIHPEEWEERVAAAFADDRPLTGIADPFQDRAAFPSWVKPDRLSERYRDDQALTRIALEIEDRLHPDLLMVLLPGVDRICHVLWGALEPPEIYRNPPAMTAEEREASAGALHRYYEYADALIGRLMQAYGPDDLVVVVSDHGFEAGRSLAGVTGVHSTRKALLGVIFASGRGIRLPLEKQPVSVNDVTPTILAWLGLPVGADMDGRVASFLADAEVERIASHDAAPIERLSHVPSGAEGEILQQLRALGYLENDASE